MFEIIFLLILVIGVLLVVVPLTVLLFWVLPESILRFVLFVAWCALVLPGLGAWFADRVAERIQKR